MTSNLAKSPLMALFSGALFYLAGAYIPYSEEYLGLTAEFTATLSGTLFLFAFALWLSLIAAVGFGSANKSGIKAIVLLTVPMLGTAWVLPNLESILYAGHPGVMGRADTMLSMAFYAVCTILAIVLFTLNYNTKSPAAVDPRAPAPPQTAYRIKPVELIIKILVLPLIYTILFFVAWYFLHWTNDEVRAFYGGPVEGLGFVSSVVRVLLDMGWMLILSLAKGLGYTLFALPLLFLFPGKRVVYIALTVMLNLSACVWLLIPTPLMADSIRISNLIYNAALLLVFSVLSAFLLHTCFKRVVTETPQQQRSPVTPRQQAMAKARSAQQQAAQSPTVKNAAAAVSTTMKGDV